VPKVSTSVRQAHQADGWFNMLWTYATVAFANVIFQGLLSMHVLLDNPYGNHCCKFPLRAQITELLNASRTLLTRADELPSMFLDVFEPRPESDRRNGSSMANVPNVRYMLRAVLRSLLTHIVAGSVTLLNQQEIRCIESGRAFYM
jgi:hypothetical protein